MDPFTDYPRYHDPKLNWADLTWLKDLAQGTPIYLKGVSHIDVSRFHLAVPLQAELKYRCIGRANGEGAQPGRVYLIESCETVQLILDISLY